MSEIIKIGFIDYYLDEWHANNYPEFIRKASGGKAAAVYAYGHIDSPKGGRTTEQWCKDLGLERCMTIDEVIEKSDCLIVLSPDNPEMHWELCQKPLRSGKRVYVDKTFAPTAQIARDLFALAEEYHTPVYSSSALRYTEQFDDLPEKEPSFLLTYGPGLPENYLVHQFEPLAMIMKAPARKVMYTKAGEVASYLFTFDGDKVASASLFGWSGPTPYMVTVRYTDGSMFQIPDASGYFDRFIAGMVHFFETGEGVVDKSETISVMAMIEAAHKAEEKPGEWVDIDD